MLAGSPDEWLAHFRGLGEQMSEAIEAAWPICIGPLQAKKGALTHEDGITVHLVQALIRTKKVPGRIAYQYALMVKDANGNVLANGDAVVLIKDLKVKGSSITLKMGTKVKSIRLVGGAHGVGWMMGAGNIMQ